MDTKTRGLSTILTLTCLGAGISALAIYTSTVAMKKHMPAPVFAKLPQSERPFSNATLMRLAGFDAEACAIAGLTAEQTHDLAARGRQHLTEAGTTIQAAYAAHCCALTELASAEQTTRQGADAGLSQKRTTAEAASGTLNTLLASVISAATNGLTEQQIARFASLRATHAVKLPSAYYLVERTEAEAISLRDALAEARIAQRNSQQTPAAAAEIIQTAQSDAATAAALANLASLSTYRQAWTNGLNGE